MHVTLISSRFIYNIIIYTCTNACISNTNTPSIVYYFTSHISDIATHKQTPDLVNTTHTHVNIVTLSLCQLDTYYWFCLVLVILVTKCRLWSLSAAVDIRLCIKGRDTFYGYWACRECVLLTYRSIWIIGYLFGHFININITNLYI